MIKNDNNKPETKTMSKFTRATFKKFLRENKDNMEIQCESRFDGMTDMVERCDSAWTKTKPTDGNLANTFGIVGAWLVGRGGDYFTPYTADGFSYVGVYNCCGSFTLRAKI